ncbi:hypothetical protein OAS39_08805 [Pirellulales bacterium]|nr:hypothetical protein [Pirellulales bacterium]
MDIFAPIVRNLITPAWAIWERSPYLRHYKRLLKSQYDPPDNIRQRQWELFQTLLQHAYETSCFYHSRMQAAGLLPEDIRSFGDLHRLPLLTKQDLREHLDDILSDRFDRRTLKNTSTSGSTGVAVQIFADEENDQLGRACGLRSDEWSGWRLGERIARIWGNPDYLQHGWRGWLRNHCLERATYLDTLKMDREALMDFARKLRESSPSLIMGHAHSLFLFAEFLHEDTGPPIHPHGIISTAMVLHDWERRKIEEVFQCPVTNRYGCEEVGLIACQCEEHGGLHINSDAVFIEILRSDGTPAAPGEVGRVIVTHLTNYPMPFIRYEIGDMAAFSDETCPCGRTLPMLDRIEGRVADFIVTPRGELVSGISLTENFAMLVPGVVQLQIVQEKIDRFLFRIVKASNFGRESEEMIEKLVVERFGDDVRYECEFLDRIDQEPSGKYRFCISKVDKDAILSTAQLSQ